MLTSLTAIFGGLLSYILIYKYAALFCIGFIAALALPLPASTMLAAAGAFASQGYLELPYVLATAFAANILGDTTGYLIARRYGERTFRAIGLGKVLSSKRYLQLGAYMRRFPQSVIFISRFMTEVGPLATVLSGLSGVGYRTYFTFAVLGETAYVFLYGLSGYYLGNEWEDNIGFMLKAVAVIISIGVTLNLLQWFLAKR